MPTAIQPALLTRFPASPEEWSLRPYFLWDYALSWTGFV